MATGLRVRRALSRPFRVVGGLWPALAALAVAVFLAAPAAAQSSMAAGAPPQEVTGPEISILIRSAVAALDHANVTGNYTVLRDLGSSDMRAANSAARLTDLFREFRERRLILAPAILYDPLLDEDPQLTTDGVLRLVGHFPVEPQNVLFDMTFRYEAGAWRISVLTVGTRMADGSKDEAQLVASGGPQQAPSPPPQPQAAPAGGGQPLAVPAPRLRPDIVLIE